MSNICPQPTVNLVKEFKCEIKCNTTQFPTLKDNAAWDNWSQSTEAQAQAQDLIDVLDPNYTPPTIEDAELFQEKQKFMYAVFEKTLLTDKGEALVCQHQHSFDAQKFTKSCLRMPLNQPKHP